MQVEGGARARLAREGKGRVVAMRGKGGGVAGAPREGRWGMRVWAHGGGRSLGRWCNGDTWDGMASHGRGLPAGG